MHNVESMFSVREVPWHGLGKVLKDAPTSKDAITEAGLDWLVIPRKVWVEVEPTQVEAGEPVIMHGESTTVLKLANEFVANVRASDGSVLGIVSDEYRLVQNWEAFEFTDSLVQDGIMRYETAGSLRNGRIIWLLGRLSEHKTILNDKVEPYVLFMNTHDGTGSVRVLTTPVRVVCNNTLNLALNKATGGIGRSWSTIHTGNMQEKLAEARRTLGLVNQFMLELEQFANTLVHIWISDDQWEDIVSDLLPIGENDSERRRENIMVAREALVNRAYIHELRPYYNTGWACVNAVADFVAHYKPENSPSKFHRIVNGHPMLDRATEMIMQLTV